MNGNPMDPGPALELGMQELEAMEAPTGWWTVVSYIGGFSVGGGITVSIVATLIT